MIENAQNIPYNNSQKVLLGANTTANLDESKSSLLGRNASLGDDGRCHRVLRRWIVSSNQISQ